MSGRGNRLFVLVVSALVVATLVGIASVVLTARPTACSYLGEVSDFAPNTVTRPACAPVFVVMNGEHRQVFLALTPHLAGEPLFWDAPTNTFTFRGHGERFSPTGMIIEGPATRPLWECPVEVRGRQLWIKAGSGATPNDIGVACKHGG